MTLTPLATLLRYEKHQQWEGIQVQRQGRHLYMLIDTLRVTRFFKPGSEGRRFPPGLSWLKMSLATIPNRCAPVLFFERIIPTYFVRKTSTSMAMLGSHSLSFRLSLVKRGAFLTSGAIPCGYELLLAEPCLQHRLFCLASLSIFLVGSISIRHLICLCFSRYWN